MKHRKAVNCLLLCAGAHLVIATNFVDIPILDWLGDALLFAGIALIVLVGMLIVVASPLCLFLLEDDVLKNELNNAYINDGYTDWYEVNIEPIGRFLLPDSWSIAQEESIYSIRDNQNEVIAHAAILGKKMKTEGTDVPSVSWSECRDSLHSDSPWESESMCCRRRAVGKQLFTGQLHMIVRISRKKDENRRN